MTQVKHLKRGTIYNVLGTAKVLGGIGIADDDPIIVFKNQEGIFVTQFKCHAPSFDCEFVYFGRAQTEVTLGYGDLMVVYQDINDLKVYARAEAEFWDGRFVETNFMQENLEFESGQLVKYNKRRIEYMDGYELIRMCKEMGKLLAQNKSPAAPVEGLETVAWRAENYDIDPSATTHDKTIANGWAQFSPDSPLEELVTRSQAEAIIAAEREARQRLLDIIEEANAEIESSEVEKVRLENRILVLETDNAALTARVKELETIGTELSNKVRDALLAQDKEKFNEIQYAVLWDGTDGFKDIKRLADAYDMSVSNNAALTARVKEFDEAKELWFEGVFTECDFDLRGGDYDCVVLRKDGGKFGDLGEGERVFYNEITNKLDATNLNITIKKPEA